MHFNFLKKIKRLIHNFLNYSKYGLIGLLIKVHGKFQGVLRKRRFKYAYGKTSMTSFNTFIDYDLQKSYTKFGVFSIKVYLMYSK
jgi:ribosomal protein S3